jgi:hypothetical protein
MYLVQPSRFKLTKIKSLALEAPKLPFKTPVDNGSQNLPTGINKFVHEYQG